MNSSHLLKVQHVGEGEKDWEFGISRSKLKHRMDKQQGPTIEHREIYTVRAPVCSITNLCPTLF